nr:hypothetical protein HmN_000930500 [Hymenolepis microstoma]
MSSSHSPNSPFMPYPNKREQFLLATTKKSPHALTSLLHHLTSPHSSNHPPPPPPPPHSLHLLRIYQLLLFPSDYTNAHNSNDIGSLPTPPPPPPPHIHNPPSATTTTITSTEYLAQVSAFPFSLPSATSIASLPQPHLPSIHHQTTHLPPTTPPTPPPPPRTTSLLTQPPQQYHHFSARSSPHSILFPTSIQTPPPHHSHPPPLPATPPLPANPPPPPPSPPTTPPPPLLTSSTIHSPPSSVPTTCPPQPNQLHFICMCCLRAFSTERRWRLHIPFPHPASQSASPPALPKSYGMAYAAPPLITSTPNNYSICSFHTPTHSTPHFPTFKHFTFNFQTPLTSPPSSPLPPPSPPLSFPSSRADAGATTPIACSSLLSAAPNFKHITSTHGTITPITTSITSQPIQRHLKQSQQQTQIERLQNPLKSFILHLDSTPLLPIPTITPQPLLPLHPHHSHHFYHSLHSHHNPTSQTNTTHQQTHPTKPPSS